LRSNQTAIVATIKKATKQGVAAGQNVDFEGSIGLHGIYITDDFNYSAPLILNVISDSIGWGAQLSNTPDMWVYQVRNYLLSLGYNVRLRNFSISGSTMIQHDNAFKIGRYNYNEPGLTLICLGTNDANTGSALAAGAITTFTNSVNSIIAQADYLMPQQPKIFVGPATLGNATNEANLANLSSIISSAVATKNSAYYKYCPRTGFTANATNLGGDNIHPTAVGHALIAANVNSYLGSSANGVLSLLV
ncbi:MAG: SGNH/GDSL hydrolase family protein, partial [Williamsia sp.]|nr:SGNH/GDSL hydrolase family protein [Williamsia sp.]